MDVAFAAAGREVDGRGGNVVCWECGIGKPGYPTDFILVSAQGFQLVQIRDVEESDTAAPVAGRDDSTRRRKTSETDGAVAGDLGGKKVEVCKAGFNSSAVFDVGAKGDGGFDLEQLEARSCPWKRIACYGLAGEEEGLRAGGVEFFLVVILGCCVLHRLHDIVFILIQQQRA